MFGRDLFRSRYSRRQLSYSARVSSFRASRLALLGVYRGSAVVAESTNPRIITSSIEYPPSWKRTNSDNGTALPAHRFRQQDRCEPSREHRYRLQFKHCGVTPVPWHETGVTPLSDLQPDIYRNLRRQADALVLSTLMQNSIESLFA